MIPLRRSRSAMMTFDRHDAILPPSGSGNDQLMGIEHPRVQGGVQWVGAARIMREAVTIVLGRLEAMTSGNRPT
jgi:hypothetical protein